MLWTTTMVIYARQCADSKKKLGLFLSLPLTRIWHYDYIFPSNKSALFAEDLFSFGSNFMLQSYNIHFLEAKCYKTCIRGEEECTKILSIYIIYCVNDNNPSRIASFTYYVIIKHLIPTLFILKYTEHY